MKDGSTHDAVSLCVKTTKPVGTAANNYTTTTTTTTPVYARPCGPVEEKLDVTPRDSNSGFLPLLGDLHITEMEMQGRRALSCEQGSSEKNETFGIILSLSNEATTSSPPCRRRSVWPYYWPGIATSAIAACASADNMDPNQRHAVDFAPGDGLSMRSPARVLRLPLLSSHLEADIVRAQALFSE